jgi:hypothetical protein
LRAVNHIISTYARSIANGKPLTLPQTIQEVQRQLAYLPGGGGTDELVDMLAFACAQAAGAYSRTNDREAWPEQSLRGAIESLQALLDARDRVRRDTAAEPFQEALL